MSCFLATPAIRGSRLVHEVGGLTEQDALSAVVDLGDLGRQEPGLAEALTFFAREFLRDHAAEVVTTGGIPVAGIAQPGDEPGHGSGLAALLGGRSLGALAFGGGLCALFAFLALGGFGSDGLHAFLAGAPTGRPRRGARRA